MCVRPDLGSLNLRVNSEFANNQRYSYATTDKRASGNKSRSVPVCRCCHITYDTFTFGLEFFLAAVTTVVGMDT